MQGNHRKQELPKQKVIPSAINVKKVKEKFERFIQSAPNTPLASPTNSRAGPVFDFSVSLSSENLFRIDPTRPLEPLVSPSSNLIPREYVGAAAAASSAAVPASTSEQLSSPPSPSSGSADRINKTADGFLRKAKSYLAQLEPSVVGTFLHNKKSQPMEEDPSVGTKRTRERAPPLPRAWVPKQKQRRQQGRKTKRKQWSR